MTPPIHDTAEKINCILVKKNGTLKQLRHVPPSEMHHSNYVALTETSDSYKDAFRLHTTWKVPKHKVSVELWARATGRAGQENKYEFPPPVDEVLFFGSCLLVAVDAPSNFSFTLESWKKIYATLFGGFHDLSKTAEADESEYDEMVDIPKKRKTREGYLKDGFIVEDSKKIQQPSATHSSSSSSSVISKQKSGGKSKKNSTAQSNTNTVLVPAASSVSSDMAVDELELEEDAYLEYDDDQ